MSKKIKLTQGKYAIVDDEDYGRISMYKWYAIKRLNTYYSQRRLRNREWNGVGNQWLSMHRAIMNAAKGQEVDHVDSNGLNNTRSNLRFCSHSQNMQNIKYRGANKTGYKGVYWLEDRKRFQAQIRANGKRKTIGYFKMAKEAATAYDWASKKYHGEFGNANEQQGKCK